MKYLFYSVLVLLFMFSTHGFAQKNTDASGCPTSKRIEVPSNTTDCRNYLEKTYTPQIVNSFPSPFSYCTTIAFDGENLWCGGYFEEVIFPPGSSTGQLINVSRDNGTVLKSIQIPFNRNGGLTFFNAHLWAVDTDHLIVYKVDTSNGNTVYTFNTPSLDSNSYPRGIEWDGEKFWLNEPLGPYEYTTPVDSMFIIDSLGNKISGFEIPLEYGGGLAFDGEFMWVSDPSLNLIFKMDTASHNMIDTVLAPGGTYADGLTWDGCYLWLVNNQSDSIYQLDVYGNNPNLFYTYINSDLLVNFSGYSDTALSWYWEFGDGTFDTVQNPIHQYDSSGTYHTCVHVTIPCGQTVSYCLDITVFCQPPKPDFTYTGEYIDSSMIISCFGNNLTGADWYWDFGDGDTSHLEAPVHIYNATTPVQICLYITDSCGTGSSCMEINHPVWLDFPNNKSKDLVTVYPNPIQSYIIIKLPQRHNKISVILYNLLGEVVEQFSYSETNMAEINLPNISTGTYTLKIKSESLEYHQLIFVID